MDSLSRAVPIFPLPPHNSKQPVIHNTLLYNGSRFVGQQKSKGNSYEVEVSFQAMSNICNNN